MNVIDFPFIGNNPIFAKLDNGNLVNVITKIYFYNQHVNIMRLYKQNLTIIPLDKNQY